MVEFVIKIIIPLMCAILTVYIIPILKEKKLYDTVVIAVNAAEQIFNESGMGKEKFTYVSELIKKKFHISDEDLKNIIESAVYELNKNKLRIIDSNENL